MGIYDYEDAVLCGGFGRGHAEDAGAAGVLARLDERTGEDREKQLETERTNGRIFQIVLPCCTQDLSGIQTLSM